MFFGYQYFFLIIYKQNWTVNGAFFIIKVFHTLHVKRNTLTRNVIHTKICFLKRADANGKDWISIVGVSEIIPKYVMDSHYDIKAFNSFT